MLSAAFKRHGDAEFVLSAKDLKQTTIRVVADNHLPRTVKYLLNLMASDALVEDHCAILGVALAADYPHSGIPAKAWEEICRAWIGGAP
jgi:hypothetical protein